jgi:hypothetical protein
MVKLKASGAHAGLDAGSWRCHGRRLNRGPLYFASFSRSGLFKAGVSPLSPMDGRRP